MPFEVENNGHVIEVGYGTGSTLRVAAPGSNGPVGVADEYKLLQFHFHTPSEHTIDGKHSDMELHLVHVNVLGDVAVVAIMMNIGSDGNYLVDRIINLAPNTVGHEKSEGSALNARQLLPSNLNYYMYSGSLTTPPCTEGVRWFVLRTPVAVSSAAVQRSKDIIRALPGYEGFDNNNRPIVPINGRAVVTNR